MGGRGGINAVQPLPSIEASPVCVMRWTAPLPSNADGGFFFGLRSPAARSSLAPIQEDGVVVGGLLLSGGFIPMENGIKLMFFFLFFFL